MKALREFDRIADEIADKFCKDYFDSIDYYWIGDDRTGLVFISDYYVTLVDMVYALKHAIAVESFFDYYNKNLERAYVEPYQSKWNSLRHYIRDSKSKK